MSLNEGLRCLSEFGRSSVELVLRSLSLLSYFCDPAFHLRLDLETILFELFLRNMLSFVSATKLLHALIQSRLERRSLLFADLNCFLLLLNVFFKRCNLAGFLFDHLLFGIDHRVTRFDARLSNGVRVNDIANHLLVLIERFFFFLVLVRLSAELGLFVFSFVLQKHELIHQLFIVVLLLSASLLLHVILLQSLVSFDLLLKVFVLFEHALKFDMLLDAVGALLQRRRNKQEQKYNRKPEEQVRVGRPHRVAVLFFMLVILKTHS